MCIAAWVWQSHPTYQLLLFFNRDEYQNRPTKAMGWWAESEERILGGRDEIGGGTWLGCTRNGRVAFLTNFREPGPFPPNAMTRGALPLRFLESTKSPHEFAKEIAKETDQYNGFNLIVADLHSRTMVYISNRPKGEIACVQTVTPGFHVLSNGKLDDPWPKAERLRENLHEFLAQYRDEEVIPEQVIDELMRNRLKANRNELPNTGVDAEWEHELSSIFIETDTKLGRYGTRSMAALSAKADGEATFYERYLENGVWKDHSIGFRIENSYET